MIGTFYRAAIGLFINISKTSLPEKPVLVFSADSVRTGSGLDNYCGIHYLGFVSKCLLIL
jgi:hypothetical protein